MIRNTIESWGWPARTLHWIVAELVIGLFGFGLWMTEVPPREEVIST
jgi:cytochrome b561